VTIQGPVAADANILIALLDTGNVHHDAVQRTVGNILPAATDQAGTLAYVHPLNMAEVLYGFRPDSRSDLLDALRDSPGVGFQIRPIVDGRQEALLLARYRERVKMPDACLLALAAAYDLPVLTLDDRLHHAAGAFGLALVDVPEPGGP
jgi:predicted nucleic acid-binding protein